MTAGSSSPWEPYVKSAANLRESIARNRTDSLFADDNKEIVYIFDANIFVFEADINDDLRLTTDIDSLVGAGPEEAEMTRVLERLTANFLFSGGLPAQLEKKAFITLPHLAEALDVAKQIAKTLDHRDPAARALMRQREIRDFVSSVLDGPGSTQSKLSELGQELPKTWLEALDAKAHFRRVLREAFVDPQMLVPLDKRDWGIEAGSVTHTDVQPWLNALPEISLSRDLEIVRADAITLATMVNLYLNDKRARGPNRERLYVLVTSDRHLAKAVKRRLPILRMQGIPNFIRSPEDYLPLLNLNAMSMALSSAPSNPQLRTAFRAVFEALSAAVDWIAFMEETAPNAGFLLERDPVGHLQKTWSKISEFIAVLNVPYVKDAAWMFEELRDYLTPETRAKAAGFVEVSVLEVSDQHLLLLLDSTLAGLRQNQEAKAAGPRRIHLQVLGDIFATLIPKGDLDRYVNIVVEKGTLTPSVRDALGKQADRAEVQLLAACLFITADRWALGSQAASRGLESLERSRHPSSYRLDARYLVAHCLRFSMRTDADLQRADQLLNLNLQSYAAHEDSSGLAWRRRLRDEIEHGSLLVTAAVMQALAPTSAGRQHLGTDIGWFLFENVTSSAYLAEGARLLLSALDELQDSEPINVHTERGLDRDQQFLEGLKRQAVTNIVEAFIFEQIGPGLQGDSPMFEDKIDDLIDLLGDIIATSTARHEALLLTHHIYYWRARFLVAKSGEEREQYLTLLRSYLEQVKQTHKLPLIDLLEFQYIEDQLHITARTESAA